MARFERGFDRRGGSRPGFRPRREGPSLPCPLKVGEEYDVEISEVGSRGDGIARVKNFVIFVADTKKGDKTRIKIKEVRNRFAVGEKVGEAGAAEEVTEEAEAPEAEEKTEESTEEAAEEVEEVTEEKTEESTEEAEE